MSAPSATSRDLWLAAARAKGGHLGDCPRCSERPPLDCSEYDVLSATERVAWDALSAERQEAAPSRAGHAGRGGRG